MSIHSGRRSRGQRCLLAGAYTLTSAILIACGSGFGDTTPGTGSAAPGAGGATDASGTGPASGAGAGSSSSSGMDACDPKLGKLGSSCGVFVSSSLGKDTNSGSQSMPFATLQHAVDDAGGKDVYACAEEFAESVSLSAKTVLYGGLDCANGWAYVGASKKTTIKGPANAIVMTVKSSADGSYVRDVRVEAATAMQPGGFSIAVVVDNAGVGFEACDLAAGDGAPGKNGNSATQTPPATPGKGHSGLPACSDFNPKDQNADATNAGASETTNTCGPNVSIGGKGGDGNIMTGSDGEAGQVGKGGAPGAGEPALKPWSCAQGTGQQGDPGKTGGAGKGGTALGAISSTGYVGDSGGLGEKGTPGQGGGGGGGAKGGAICTVTPMNPTGLGGGASGGAGGAGGCGGAEGAGGGAGGASIALVSIRSDVVLTNCTLTSGNGAAGGSGGDYQPGGLGGNPGDGGTPNIASKPGCPGGIGGRGGDGGPGGGGRGGHSLAIAFISAAPTLVSTTTMHALQGVGGKGGNANEAGNNGADGIATEQQEFK